MSTGTASPVGLFGNKHPGFCSDVTKKNTSQHAMVSSPFALFWATHVDKASGYICNVHRVFTNICTMHVHKWTFVSVNLPELPQLAAAILLEPAK